MSRIPRPPVLLAAAALVLGSTSPGVQAVDTPSGAPGRAEPRAALASTPELSETTRLQDRRSLVVGDRAYALGTADGLYPAAGFHTRGEMGGVWTPPIKLVDGVWIRLADQWLGDAAGGRGCDAHHRRVGLHPHVVRGGRPGARGADRLRAGRHPRHARRTHPDLAGVAQAAGGAGRPLGADGLLSLERHHPQRHPLQPAGHRVLRPRVPGLPRAGHAPGRQRRAPRLGRRRRQHRAAEVPLARPRPPWPAGPGRHLPDRGHHARHVRRQRRRQGHRWPAAMAAAAPRRHPDHDLVRGRRFRPGPRGRPHRARHRTAGPGRVTRAQGGRPDGVGLPHPGRPAR